MEFQLHGSRFVVDQRSSDMQTCVGHLSNQVHYNFGGSWQRRQRGPFKVADLQSLRDIKDAMGKRIKLRVEDPWVQLYTKDVDTLEEVAKMLSPNIKNSIDSVSWPESEEQLAILGADTILMRYPNGYNYKCLIRDGLYDEALRTSVLNYLDNLGDEIKISKGTKNQFKQHNYIYGGFFYLKDEKIATYLLMFSPTLIKKIYKLVPKPE
jgi:hypothetical protein